MRRFWAWKGSSSLKRRRGRDQRRRQVPRSSTVRALQKHPRSSLTTRSSACTGYLLHDYRNSVYQLPDPRIPAFWSASWKQPADLYAATWKCFVSLLKKRRVEEIILFGIFEKHATDLFKVYVKFLCGTEKSYANLVVNLKKNFCQFFRKFKKPLC